MSVTFDPYHKWLAIPPGERPPNHYRLLGVELFETDLDVIASAADQRMAHVRTLQGGTHADLSQKLLNEISTARVCLLKPDKKENYDRELKAKLDAAKLEAVKPKALAKARPLATGAAASGNQASVLDDLASAYSTATHSPSAATRKKQKQAPPAQAYFAIGAIGVLALAAVVYFLATRGQPERNQTKPVAAQPAKPRPKSTTTQPETPKNAPRDNSDSVAAPTVTAPATDTAPDVVVQTQPDPAIEPDHKEQASDEPAAPSDAVEEGLPLGQPIDLLASIDPARDGVVGNWAFRGKSLKSPTGPAARLQIPVAPSAQYVLTLVVQRELGNDLEIGLVLGKSQAVLVVDGWNGSATGLQMISGRAGDINETTRHGSKLLQEGLPHTLKCIVQEKRIRVYCDAKPVIDWQGDPSRLTLSQDWAVPDKTRLFLGSHHSVIRFDKVTLTPIENQPESPPSVDIAKTNVAKAGDAKSSPDPPSAAGAIASRDSRLPVPKDTAAAVEQVKSLFKDEYARAKKPSDKTTLAKKLLEEAARNVDDPAVRYALLSEARNQAIVAAELELSLQATDELAQAFAVDGVVLELDALTTLTKAARTSSQRNLLAETSLRTMEAAIRADRYDVAKKIGTLALSTAKAAKDQDLTQQISAQLKDLKELQKAYESARKSIDLLAQDPDDPPANLAAGRYYCLVKGEWDRGLPALAKGGDPIWQRLAAVDLSKPLDAKEQAILAADWWDQGEKESAAAKTQLRRRAVHWYRSALAKLTGTDKLAAEKRIKQVPFESRLPNHRWIEILPLVDLNRHRLTGVWSREADGIHMVKSMGCSRIEAPVSVEGSYDLEFEMTRIAGAEADLPLSVGGKRCVLILCGWGGEMSGIHLVDNKPADANSTTVQKTDIVEGRRFTLSAQVRVQGEVASIAIDLDGKKFMRWEGPIAGVAADPSWKLTHPTTLGLGACTPYTFHRMRLKIVDGAAQLVD